MESEMILQSIDSSSVAATLVAFALIIREARRYFADDGDDETGAPKKSKAESVATEIEAAAAAAVRSMAESQREILREQLREIRAENAELKSEIRRLESQIATLSAELHECMRASGGFFGQNP